MEGTSPVRSAPSSASVEKESGLSRSGTADRSLLSSRFTCAAPSLNFRSATRVTNLSSYLCCTGALRDLETGGTSWAWPRGIAWVGAHKSMHVGTSLVGK